MTAAGVSSLIIYLLVLRALVSPFRITSAALPQLFRMEKPLFVFNFMDFVFIARDHMRMYLMATRPWICISTTKKACERSLVADDEEKIAEFRPNLLKF